MSDEDEGYAEDGMICLVCGETVEHTDWLLFNRTAFQSKHGARMLLEFDRWEPNEEDPDQSVFSGELVHWPVCATMYVDGLMAEASVRSGEEPTR